MKRLFALCVTLLILCVITSCGNASGTLEYYLGLKSDTAYPATFTHGTAVPGSVVMSSSFENINEVEMLSITFITPRADDKNALKPQLAETGIPLFMRRSVIKDVHTGETGKPSTIVFHFDNEECCSTRDSIQDIFDRHLEKVTLSLSAQERTMLGV